MCRRVRHDLAIGWHCRGCGCPTLPGYDSHPCLLVPEDNRPGGLSGQPVGRDKTPANKDAAEKVWAFIQSKEKNGEAKLKIPVKVVAVPDTSTLDVAISDDNQAANKADMRVTMDKPLTKPPAVGANVDIIGVISQYTPDPFMFTMTKGELPAAKATAKTPAKKGAAKKGTAKKKAAQ